MERREFLKKSALAALGTAVAGTGLVQAWIRKPKVEDMEFLVEDAGTFKGYYKNRILRVLLVFMLSSVGGVIGNFIAVPSLFASMVK